MCTPPFCEPARRCLGCISLRKAAGLIILLNAIYGIFMVVVHVFIFRERSTIMSAMAASSGALAPVTAAPLAAPVIDGGGISSRHNHNWYLQIVDLDIAWAHGVLGLGDWYLCMLGLIYGLIIIFFSTFVLNAVVGRGPSSGVVSRWFMMFLHLELILYICLVFTKLPLLCDIKKHFLTLMDEDCNVLRFMFFERAVLRIAIGALCSWVFSSFAYLLAWGDAAVDDATNGDDLDLDHRHTAGWHGSQYPSQVSPASMSPPMSSPYGDNVVQVQHRGSFNDNMVQHRGSFTTVGEPVNVSSKYEPRFISPTANGPTRGSFIASAGGSFPPQQGRFGGSQHIMPRASSSIQSNNSTAERQMLIKPPIVIH